MSEGDSTKKREEALPERLMRRALERVGEVVDKKFRRKTDTDSNLTTSVLVDRMQKAIDELVRDLGPKGQFAPHLMRLKVEWGKHSEAPAEIIVSLEHEVLAAAIDHINDHRYRTLAPIAVVTEADIFSSGVKVVPSFDGMESKLDQAEPGAHDAAQIQPLNLDPPRADLCFDVTAAPESGHVRVKLIFQPGGRRLSVGRGKDNDFRLDDASVSKVHAALTVNHEGTLLVADTGSTNGTSINGRRLTYGEARQIEDGDVVGFGFVEARFYKDA